MRLALIAKASIAVGVLAIAIHVGEIILVGPLAGWLSVLSVIICAAAIGVSIRMLADLRLERVAAEFD